MNTLTRDESLAKVMTSQEWIVLIDEGVRMSKKEALANNIVKRIEKLPVGSVISTTQVYHDADDREMPSPEYKKDSTGNWYNTNEDFYYDPRTSEKMVELLGYKNLVIVSKVSA